METDREICVYTPPLPDDLIRELLCFWQGAFQTEYEPFRGILAGEEQGANQDVFYLMHRGERIVGTCHLTVAASNPQLGGLGEVATAPECRGQGLAGRLCARARDDFRQAGGQALFLGTNNPAAARIYHRLGWRKLAGANVMAWIAQGGSPEAFLVDYFRQPGAVTIAPGSAAERIPMIPLIVSPHDWQVLDAAAGLFSTRYSTQTSCMGLYPRYVCLADQGRGAWFAARTAQGQTVGLSSARLDESGACQLDAFTHGDHADCWTTLVEAALDWAAAQQACSCWVRVSTEDEEKAFWFERLGFRQGRQEAPFELGGREVGSVRWESRG
jgi:GNAT superfamily N-acetyltransferase